MKRYADGPSDVQMIVYNQFKQQHFPYLLRIEADKLYNSISVQQQLTT